MKEPTNVIRKEREIEEKKLAQDSPASMKKRGMMENGASKLELAKK